MDADPPAWALKWLRSGRWTLAGKDPTAGAVWSHPRLDRPVPLHLALEYQREWADAPLPKACPRCSGPLYIRSNPRKETLDEPEEMDGDWVAQCRSCGHEMPVP